MSKATEKENIAQIRAKVEQIKQLKNNADKINAAHDEIKALLRMRYPSSEWKASNDYPERHRREYERTPIRHLQHKIYYWVEEIKRFEPDTHYRDIIAMLDTENGKIREPPEICEICGKEFELTSEYHGCIEGGKLRCQTCHNEYLQSNLKNGGNLKIYDMRYKVPIDKLVTKIDNTDSKLICPACKKPVGKGQPLYVNRGALDYQHVCESCFKFLKSMCQVE